MNKKEIKILNKCDNCKLKECIECEFTWADIQEVKKYIEELEQLNNKYLQKMVYALTPTTHALDNNYNNAFKKIIAENIDLETCKIKRKLKECWGTDKY